MIPAYQDEKNAFYQGDAGTVLQQLPEQSVHCTVSSPPYYGLRSYLEDSHPDKHLEIGGEESPQAYVDRMAGVFREVRRVLRDDGTLWLNLGDSYVSSAKNRTPEQASDNSTLAGTRQINGGILRQASKLGNGVPAKGLLGIPWRVALALQDDGWILRQDIVWEKPSCMPSSVKDRCTTSHEYLFLLTKQPKYFYDQEAVKEPCSPKTFTVNTTPRKGNGTESTGEKLNKWMEEKGGRYHPLTRNRRSVWRVAASPYKKAHYATFPPKLIEPCIMAGTSESGCCGDCGAPLVRQVERRTVYRQRPNATTDRHAQGNGVNSTPNDKAGVETVTTGWLPSCKCGNALSMPWKPCVVLDPFLGSGTTAMVANRLGRNCIGIDLSGEYITNHAIERVTA